MKTVYRFFFWAQFGRVMIAHSVKLLWDEIAVHSLTSCEHLGYLYLVFCMLSCRFQEIFFRSDGPKRRQQLLWHEMKSLSPIWPIASYNDLCEGRSIFYINTYLEACHPQDDYHICKSLLLFILLLTFWGWFITCFKIRYTCHWFKLL